MSGVLPDLHLPKYALDGAAQRMGQDAAGVVIFSSMGTQLTRSGRSW